MNASGEQNKINICLLNEKFQFFRMPNAEMLLASIITFILHSILPMTNQTRRKKEIVPCNVSVSVIWLRVVSLVDGFVGKV